jgi:Fe-Mn family superoxide dismutase
MLYNLPELSYSFDSLEPFIDALTLKIHYTKHHQGYVDKLNEALKDYPKYQKYPVEVLVANWKKLPKAIQDAVRNQGGGHANHTMFWTIMKSGGGNPTGELAIQINKDFGSFDKFQKKFNEAGTKFFGSGWVWLVFVENKLRIAALPNQDSPLINGDFPIMGNDLWEHAYYLKYHNKRDEYLDAWWNVLNWEAVGRRYQQAKVIAVKKPIKNVVQKQFGI